MLRHYVKNLRLFGLLSSSLVKINPTYNVKKSKNYTYSYSYFVHFMNQIENKSKVIYSWEPKPA